MSKPSASPEQGLDLPARGFLLDRLDRGLALADGGLVTLHLAEFDQRRAILEIAFELLDRGDGLVELLALAHDLLCGLWIVPEVGVLEAAFSSARRLSTVSQSKMPPQQPYRLLGGIRGLFDLGAHLV